MSRKKNKQGFQPPRQVEDLWNLYKKDVYVEKPPHNIPPWLLPLIIFLLIVVIIFWAAPTVLQRVQSRNQDQEGQETVALAYGKDIFTVAVPIADVFDRDDIKGRRVTQALYNEPVSVSTEPAAYGFSPVTLQDGTAGYMLTEELSSNHQSIEPALALKKVIVSTSSKRIMSHATKGTLLVEVMMGTVLYADYQGDGILRVQLPDSQQGWISDEGVIVLPADGTIETTTEGARYFCSSAMTFHRATVLDQGQSISGISMTGAVRLAAFVNGIILPRSIEGQMAAGQAISLTNVADTGLPDLSGLLPGDLVFLRESALSDQVTQVAICMESGQFLLMKNHASSISLVDPAQDTDLQSRIAAVRRLF